MKKIFLIIIMLFITSISYSQLHIGRTLTLRDSSGYLVLNGKMKTWNSQYLFTNDMDSSVAGDGLFYTINNGLSVNVGNGLYIENDTIKNSLFTRTYSDSVTIFKNVATPILRFTNTNTNIAYIKLNEQNLLQLEPSNVIALENFSASSDIFAGRDIFAYTNFRIGDDVSSDIVIDGSRRIYSSELHTFNNDNIALYLDSALMTTTNGFDGGGFTPSSESYYGDGSALMTSPFTWITIQVEGINYLVPLYLP